MKKSILILVILISFLLLSSIVSAQVTPLDIISNFLNSILSILGLTTTQEKVIPSSGTIVYSKFPAKTITWGDGTTETIQVSDKGEVYLNGNEVKPFGFSFFGWLSTPEAALENILDWMDSNGVRFVDIYFNTNVGGLTDRVNFYMPKFYAHKKFVRLIVAPEYWYVFTNYDEWETRFDAVIDQICTNSNWADTIYALEVTHEPALVAKRDGKTVQQLSDTLDAYYNHANAKISVSDIGSVPIIHAEAVWANPSDTTYRDYWEEVLKETDIMLFDYYPASVSDIINDKIEYAARATAAGKNPASGYKMWHEFGSHVIDPSDNDNEPVYVSVDFFTTLLNHSYTGDVFLFYAYENWDGNPEFITWYFDNNGNAEPWTEALAPYFP